MKNKILNILSLFALLSMLIISGCDDDMEVGPTVTVNSVDPLAAFTLDEVTLEGANLHTVINVFVGDRHTEITSQSETSLTFIVPRTAEPGPNVITLAMEKGYRVTNPLEVLVRPIPEIEAISPSAADIGETVTIRGINLGELSSATIGGMEATIVSASNSELVLEVPGGLPINTEAVIELSTTEATTTSESVFYVGPNLVANSDLEGGSGDEFDNWEKLNGGDQMTGVTGTEAYFGRSMHIVPANNNPWNTQLATQEMQLNLNSEYTAFFWAKAEAEGAIMRVSSSQFNHHGSGSDFFYGETVDIPTEWTQLSWTFTVTADLPSYKLVLDMGEGNVPFLIDNVTLIETGAAGPPIPENVIANSGFEDGLESWEVLNGTFEISSEEVHCGSQALKVTGAGNPDQPWRTQISSTDLPLEAGTEYEVSFWALSTAPDVEVSVSLSRYNGGDGSDYFYSAAQTITEEWAEYTWRFTAQDPPSGLQALVMDLGRSDQVFYIDDVSIKEYIAPINILPDPSFEDGIRPTSEGAVWEVLNGTIEETTVADEVFDGAKAVKVTSPGGNPWETQMASDPIPLTVGNRYGIRLRAKAAGPGGEIRVSVSRYTDGSDPRSDYFYGDNVAVTEEWAEYNWTFEVLTDLPDGHSIVLDLGEFAQTYFIDMVEVYEIPPFSCP